MKADLHVHTNISDSNYSIEETIQMAKEQGITHLGIVDHDTTLGLKKAIEVGEKYGIKIIPGIEISAYDYKNNRKVHILGYKFDLNAHNIKNLCDPIIKKRHNNSLWQIEKLIENGYKIRLDEVYEKAKYSTCIYKQHIMDVLIEKGYTDKIYSSLYKQLFKGNGICARDIEYIDVFDAVKAIKGDGGIAVLAHPGQLKSYDLIDDLVEIGLDGIELYHEDHTDADHRKILEYQEKYNLILTGGSDYHGDYGSNFKIGDFLTSKEYIKFFDNEIEEALKFIKPIVKQAGEILKEAVKNHISINFKNSDHRDLVTKYDIKIEEFLIEKILNRYPNHGFITEENTKESYVKGKYIWIIDPIDGTTNFINYKKDFAISIALYKDEEPLLGVVYDVIKDDMYVGISNKGAFLNNIPLEILDPNIVLKEAIVDVSLNSISKFRENFEADLVRLTKDIRGHRACGTASLAICRIALGEIHAYLSAKLSLWDYAAASIILGELGGESSFIFEKASHKFHRNKVTFIAACNKEISSQIIEKII
ncbi:inositol monophosphatase family protein [Maledivibacter halophilus]|uniref:inositol-phosphate phosphatase n=1 Tax=Maledivibacter halophilus TaxID=36842 RepID=A0A1T5J8V1_9FIRM|nr:inositol monophosphatase family protein [Maledivibacter halophilus]SKC47845.1 fructose-1,6-bisphosphatase [Maledivibacter halophilus]